MIFSGTVKDGKLIVKNAYLLEKYEGKTLCVDITNVKKRSDRQNRALHLWFEQLSEALNDAGYDVRSVIRKEVPIPWTAYNVKELLWRPVQEKMLGEKSTTKLRAQDIDRIYDVLNRALGERKGIYVEFPNLDALIDKTTNK